MLTYAPAAFAVFALALVCAVGVLLLRSTRPPRKPGPRAYKVRFDRSGASCVDRDLLLTLPEVQAQFESGRRIVEQTHRRRSSTAGAPSPPTS